MVYSEQHVKVTWGGGLTVGDLETWSFGCRFRLSTLPGSTEAETLFDLAAGMLTSTAVAMQNSHRLLWCKIALQDVEGRYPDGIDAVEYISETPVQGATAGGHPPQCSIACSTTTAVSRGRASRGRFYLPTSSWDTAADGMLATQVPTNMATRLAQFLDAVTDEMAAPAAVFSKIGSGTTRNIVGVRVGRVVDTQRRRRNQLPESWVSAPLNP